MKIQIVHNRFTMLGNRTIPLLVIDGELDLFSAGYLVSQTCRIFNRHHFHYKDQGKS